MQDNLTGIQPNEDNLTDWRPTDTGFSQEDRAFTNYGDPTEELGNKPDAAHEYTEKLSGAVSQAKDYLGEKFSTVGGKIKEFATDDLGGMANKAKDYARQNPGQAILVSAGVGLLLGLIVRGRR